MNRLYCTFDWHRCNYFFSENKKVHLFHAMATTYEWFVCIFNVNSLNGHEHYLCVRVHANMYDVSFIYITSRHVYVSLLFQIQVHPIDLSCIAYRYQKILYICVCECVLNWFMATKMCIICTGFIDNIQLE